ncbi:EAL domain-containing protein [Klebsiella oxytoca]|uniref:EAL domain-containing protein n=1 Tax=Klebsiella oxytoca TaxID=571 RepID=UPI00189BCC00|nr:EAL domain-containing protein [Klebsiella oxytoca]
MIKLIEDAIKDEEFKIFYQPICNLYGECIGAECLMRWIVNGKVILSPEQTLEKAKKEKTLLNLLKHLNSIVVKEANLLSEVSEFSLSVNIEAEHIENECFIDDILSLRKSLPNNIILLLELTERNALSDTPDCIDKIVRLKSDGIKIGIDDFGTGFSGLKLLSDLPVDFIKLDKFFASDYKENERLSTILNYTIELCNSLFIDLIQEGVSKEDEYITMKGKGINKFQGYFISEPMDIFRLLKWIK